MIVLNNYTLCRKLLFKSDQALNQVINGLYIYISGNEQQVSQGANRNIYFNCDFQFHC